MADSTADAWKRRVVLWAEDDFHTAHVAVRLNAFPVVRASLLCGADFEPEKVMMGSWLEKDFTFSYCNRCLEMLEAAGRPLV